MAVAAGLAPWAVAEAMGVAVTAEGEEEVTWGALMEEVPKKAGAVMAEVVAEVARVEGMLAVAAGLAGEGERGSNTLVNITCVYAG